MTIVYKRIDAIAEVIAGQSPPSDTYNQNQDGIPFFQGKGDFTEKYPNTRYWCNKPQKIALPYDILMSVRAPVGPVNICPVKACIGRGLSAIRVNNDISFEYVFLFLKNNERKIASLGVGSTFNSITQQDIKSLKIPIPDNKYDQILIATVLSKAEALIAQRKESLRLLDELLRSTFLEMFGTYFISHNYRPFGDFIDVLTDYHANGSYEILRDNVELLSTPDYALMVRTTDLENKNFENGCIYITKKAYDFLSKSKVYGGEIIINKIGSAGRVYLMPYLHRPVSLGMNAFLIRLDTNLNNIYTYYLLTSEFGTNSIQKHVKGAVTKTITKEAVRGIKIPVPPIELQNQFAAIVEKVEALKTHYHASLAELENLYGSLSQRAFKGELDLRKIEVEIHEDAQPSLEEKLTEKPTDDSPDEIRQLRGAREGTVKTPSNLDYVKGELAVQKLKGNFSYLELKKALEGLAYDMKPDTKDIKELIINLLESEPPVLEQIFDYPASDKDKKEKQIIFRLNDEDKKS